MFATHVSLLVLAAMLGVRGDTALESASQGNKKIRVEISSATTSIPMSMKLYVASNFEFEDIRGHKLSKKDLVAYMNAETPSKQQRIFRLVFVNTKDVSLRDFAQFLAYLESNAKSENEIVIHIQFRAE
jgi:hypothetical protein